MKIQLLVAVVCVTFCTGCQSSNLLSGRMGHGREEELSKLADSSTATSPSSPGLPPPTNIDPRKSAEAISSVDEHLRLGEAELRDQHDLEAQMHFEQALIVEPQHAKANHRMAVVCDKLGQFDRAERHYQLALENDPRNVAILSDLGYSYWLQGRYPESERYLLQARSIDPHYETAVANLGMLYGTTGRSEEAIAMFRQIGDEAQVQQIMQQVTTLAARRGTPATSADANTPTQLADALPVPSAEPAAVSKDAKDLSRVNEPTRELLELMEQGRRQQQLAAQQQPVPAQQQPVSAQQQPVAQQRSPQQSAWPSERVTQASGSVPSFARNRQPTPRSPSPQMVGVNPFPNQQPAVRAVGPRQVPDHLLNQALAEIDRQGRNTSGQPISIGPATTSQPRMTAIPPMDAVSATGSPHPGTMPAAQQPFQPEHEFAEVAAARSEAHGGSRERLGPPITTQPADWSQAQPPQHSSSGFAVNTLPHPDPANQFWTEPAEQLNAPQTADQLLQERAERRRESLAGSGVQQASAMTTLTPADLAGFGSPVSQPPVEHAYHQQQIGSKTNIDVIQVSMPNGDQSAAAKPNPQEQSAHNDWSRDSVADAGASDPYQQARRQAALLGLGVGPSQTLSYVQQTQRLAPGTDSRLNGGQYPAPQRQLPTAMTPANLQPAFTSPEAGQLAPRQNYQGQQLPQVAAPVNNPVKYGAASSGGNQQFRQSPQAAADPGGSLQSYDNVRHEQSRQLSGMINQTYGQPPQSPAQTASAPQSRLVNAPAATSANNGVWDLGSSSPSVPGNPAPQRGEYTKAPPRGAADQAVPRVSDLSAIVIPEPYRASPASVRVQPSAPAASPTARFSSSTGEPVIVPKSRY